MKNLIIINTYFFNVLRKVEKIDKLILQEHKKEFKFYQKNDKIFIVHFISRFYM